MIRIYKYKYEFTVYIGKCINIRNKYVVCILL